MFMLNKHLYVFCVLPRCQLKHLHFKSRTVVSIVIYPSNAELETRHSTVCPSISRVGFSSRICDVFVPPYWPTSSVNKWALATDWPLMYQLILAGGFESSVWHVRVSTFSPFAWKYLLPDIFAKRGGTERMHN